MRIDTDSKRPKGTNSQMAFRKSELEKMLIPHIKTGQDNIVSFKDFIAEVIQYCKDLNSEEANLWGELFVDKNAKNNLRHTLDTMDYKIQGGFICFGLDLEKRKTVNQLYKVLPKDIRGTLDIDVKSDKSQNSSKNFYTIYFFVKCESFQHIYYVAELISKLFSNDVLGIIVGIGVMDIRCKNKSSQDNLIKRLTEMKKEKKFGYIPFTKDETEIKYYHIGN